MYLMFGDEADRGRYRARNSSSMVPSSPRRTASWRNMTAWYRDCRVTSMANRNQKVDLLAAKAGVSTRVRIIEVKECLSTLTNTAVAVS